MLMIHECCIINYFIKTEKGSEFITWIAFKKTNVEAINYLEQSIFSKYKVNQVIQLWYLDVTPDCTLHSPDGDFDAYSNENLMIHHFK